MSICQITIVESWSWVKFSLHRCIVSKLGFVVFSLCWPAERCICIASALWTRCCHTLCHLTFMYFSMFCRKACMLWFWSKKGENVCMSFILFLEIETIECLPLLLDSFQVVYSPILEFSVHTLMWTANLLSNAIWLGSLDQPWAAYCCVPHGAHS